MIFKISFFPLNSAEIERPLAVLDLHLSDIAFMVKPIRRIKIFKDEPHNRILECALAGKADAIFKR